jgi:hypothetical protein
LAVQYVFGNNADRAGQYAAPTTTTPADSGSGENVTVIINSGVPRGQVEKTLSRALKYASLHYTPTAGA